MADTHVIVIILYSLSCEVEHSPRYDALTDEMADFKVCCQNCLRVLILIERQFIQQAPLCKNLSTASAVPGLSDGECSGGVTIQIISCFLFY